jgi:hypothetical protein
MNDVNYRLNPSTRMTALSSERVQQWPSTRSLAREAADTLAAIRETLGQTVDLAYEQQSFGPLGTLFDDEEAALAVYEQAVSTLADAEERWFALNAALAREKELMLKGQVSRSHMN